MMIKNPTIRYEAKITTWGDWLRRGQPVIVITDLGVVASFSIDPDRTSPIFLEWARQIRG